jgi:hypothetical protein
MNTVGNPICGGCKLETVRNVSSDGVVFWRCVLCRRLVGYAAPGGRLLNNAEMESLMHVKNNNA